MFRQLLITLGDYLIFLRQVFFQTGQMVCVFEKMGV